MDLLGPALGDSVESMKSVNRSPTREDKTERENGSKMFQVGFNQMDQNGHMQAPPGFKEGVDEQAKYELMAEHDHILDGVILVTSLFCFCEANVRLPRP
jgi:hypothetical protein